MSELKYTVTGMTCGHCVNSVTTEVKNVQGVKDVAVNLASNSVVVTGTDIKDNEVRQAIAEAGYEVTNPAV